MCRCFVVGKCEVVRLQFCDCCYLFALVVLEPDCVVEC